MTSKPRIISYQILQLNLMFLKFSPFLIGYLDFVKLMTKSKSFQEFSTEWVTPLLQKKIRRCYGNTLGDGWASGPTRLIEAGLLAQQLPQLIG
jgi:hypothetical protein